MQKLRPQRKVSHKTLVLSDTWVRREAKSIDIIFLLRRLTGAIAAVGVCVGGLIPSLLAE